MEGLQRSAISFRRQGSSGLVWEDRFISGELNKNGEPVNNNNQEGEGDNKKQKQGEGGEGGEGVEFRELRSSKSVGSIGGRRLMQRSRSKQEDKTTTRISTTGKVSSPVLDPPSPKLSGCGFCAGFGGGGKKTLGGGGAGGGGANHRSNKKGKRKT